MKKQTNAFTLLVGVILLSLAACSRDTETDTELETSADAPREQRTEPANHQGVPSGRITLLADTAWADTLRSTY